MRWVRVTILVVYAVIMAGGGGTRLWPLSRDRRPKPFLPLLEGGGDLLSATVDRLDPLVAPEDVYVVTDARYAGLVAASAPAVPASNILGEPMGRNTAAAVTFAALAIDRPDDEVMVVLPGDAAIADEAGFRDSLTAAAERAAIGDMITLGVEPTGPATGYGYVIASGVPETFGGRESYRVERFEEKPTPERATELLDGGAASWNAGIFVWRRSTVVEGLRRYAGDISSDIEAALETRTDVPEAAGRDDLDGGDFAQRYAQVRATSIDYALLEPASLDGRVAVVPMSVGWSDLGSWSALRDLRQPDRSETVIDAGPGSAVLEVGSEGVFVHAMAGRTVAVVGLSDVIIVDTPDAVLVLSADAAQDVKRIVDRLRDDGRNELL